MRSGVPSPSRACVCVLMQVCGSRKDAVGSEKEEERPVSLLLSVPGYSARSLERGGSGLLLLLPSTRPIEHEPWPWPRAGFLAMQSYILNDDCRPAGHTCAQSNKVPCFRRSSPEPLISCLDVQALSAGRLSFRPLGLEQRKRPKGTAQRRRIRRRRARRRSVNDTARHEGPSPYCPIATSGDSYLRALPGRATAIISGLTVSSLLDPACCTPTPVLILPPSTDVASPAST